MNLTLLVHAALYMCCTAKEWPDILWEWPNVLGEVAYVLFVGGGECYSILGE
jgi:hypothetical protein